MTTPTQNDIPSSAAIDVRYNAEKLDEFINSDNDTYLDRFGVERFTIKGILGQVSETLDDILSISSEDGASKVGYGTETVKTALDLSQRGTTPIPGLPGAITNIADAYDDISNKKFVIPNTINISKALINMTTAQSTAGMSNFEVRGQGSATTILRHPAGGATAGSGVIITLRNAIYAKIAGMMIDNSPLTRGSQGAVNIENSRDLTISDLMVAGSGNLSIYTDNCKRVLLENVRVMGQKFFTGSGKASILFGGSSEDNFAIGGGASALSLDGSYYYTGDLSDNDMGMRSVMIGMYFRGLLSSEQLVQTACCWAEGQEGRSNAHWIGCNTLGHGIGMASTELHLSTAIGGTSQSSQVRHVWNRYKFVSIGRHYFDHLGANGDTLSKAGIHHDGAKFTAVIGDMFDGGTVPDIRDYTGGTGVDDMPVVTVMGTLFNGMNVYASSSTAQHHSIVGCRQVHASISSVNQGGTRTHGVYVANGILGPIGQYGANSTGLYHEFIGITATAGDYTGAAFNSNQQCNARFINCKFLNYTGGILYSTPTNKPTFRNCIFSGITFNTYDSANMRCIDCVFINCSGTLPLSVSASGFDYPNKASIRATVAAGETLQFPDWVRTQNGIVHLKVESFGSSTGTYGEYTLVKTTSSSATPTITNVIESATGLFTPVWPASSSKVGVTFTNAGTFTISIW